jgi:hypothetical protein
MRFDGGHRHIDLPFAVDDFLRKRRGGDLLSSQLVYDEPQSIRLA